VNEVVPLRRRGRPPLHRGEAKRAQITTRIRPSVKERLDQAASANRRSVSEEIEARMEASFDEAGTVAALIGTVAALTETVAALTERIAP
jgi:hypothetical protein